MRGSAMDRIRLMTRIQITSTEDPFDSRRKARLAVGLITMAEAMGLLGEMEIRHLDLDTFRRIVDRIAAAGIGTEVQAALSSGDSAEPLKEIDQLLERLAVAMEESPTPRHEWPALDDLFGTERLAHLLNISPASVRRYANGSRPTPDAVAARLHFLARVVGELAGAYNDFGIRRWFERPRSVLEDRAPADLLTGDWDPDGSDAERIRELSRSLGASPAT